MTKSGKKNKRGARGSVEEDDTNDVKRPNMADSSNATASAFFSLPRQLRTWDESNRTKRDAI